MKCNNLIALQKQTAGFSAIVRMLIDRENSIDFKHKSKLDIEQDFSVVCDPIKDYWKRGAGNSLLGFWSISQLQNSPKNGGYRELMKAFSALFRRVKLVLRNLLNNAVKYSPDDTDIQISVNKSDGPVLTSVKEKGNGISPEDQGKLFQSFKHLGETSTSKPWLGLGLLVCRRLVESHGGKIWVESKIGEGATFFFTLPLTGWG